jgi:hypothetical protein
MNTDLRELFESGLGSEPPLPPVQVRVFAGRRALRRRRIATGSVVAAVVTALMLGVTQLWPQGTTADDPIRHPEPETPAQVEARLTQAVPVDATWWEDCGHGGQPTCEDYLVGASPVGLRADGTLVRTGSDVIVAKRAEAERADGARSVAVEVRTGPEMHNRWVVVTRGKSGAVTASLAEPHSVDFDTWAAAAMRGESVPRVPTAEAAVIIGD